MQYNPKQLDDNHNVSKTPILLEAFKLVGGMLAIFLVVYLVLGFSMDWAVMTITEETEDRYLAPWMASHKKFAPQEKAHPDEARYQKMLDSLTAEIPDKYITDDYRRKYVLQVNESETVNAFAVPGGRVILMSGLLDQAHSDDEVAFVIAHELGHFVHKDHLRGMGRGIVLVALSIMTGGDKNPATPFIIGALDAKDKQFNRYQETIADEFAVELMLGAGYDPKGGVEFMETLLDEQGDILTVVEGAMEFTSTHPATQNRLAHLKREIEMRRNGQG